MVSNTKFTSQWEVTFEEVSNIFGKSDCGNDYTDMNSTQLKVKLQP